LRFRDLVITEDIQNAYWASGEEGRKMRLAKQAAASIHELARVREGGIVQARLVWPGNKRL